MGKKAKKKKVKSKEIWKAIKNTMIMSPAEKL